MLLSSDVLMLATLLAVVVTRCDGDRCAGYTTIINVTKSCHINNQSCHSLDSALDRDNLNDTCIILQSSETLSIWKKFSKVRSFKLTSYADELTITCNTKNNRLGLHFNISDEIVIERVHFVQCGAPLFIGYYDNIALYILSTLAFVQSTNITVGGTRTEFTSSNGYALAFLDSDGNVTKTHSNSSVMRTLNASGDVVDNEKGCSSGGGIFIQYSSSKQQRVKVNSAEFSRGINRNRIHPSDLSSNSPCDKGAGINIYFRQNSQNNNVIVSNVKLDKNSAACGAGMSIIFEKKSKDNMVTMKDITFHKNKAVYRGGAVNVIDLTTYNNTVSFFDCRFDENEANAGGALSIAHQTKASRKEMSGRFVVTNSTLNNNNAVLGESMYFQNILVELTSLNLSNSSVNTLKSNNGSYPGQGALYALQCYLNFTGTSYLVTNINTAIVLESSNLYLYGSIIMTGNTGYNGGALALYEHSRLKFTNLSTLFMQHNNATSKGGAIFVHTPGPAVMPLDSTEIIFYRCFIDFIGEGTTYLNFQGNITFHNNRSPNNESNDIFVSSIESCRHPNESQKHVITGWSNFHFTSVNDSISTNAIDMSMRTFDQVYPGQMFEASIRFFDERGNRVSESINVELDNSQFKLKRNPAFFVELDGLVNMTLTGPERTIFNVSATTTSGIPLQQHLSNQTLCECSFGYVWNSKTKECMCDILNNLEKGIAECSDSKIFLLPNHWVHKRESFVCPFGYCNNNDKCNPYCPYNGQQQCSRNRKQKSRLCSRCKRSYSLVIGSQECKDCQGSSYTYVIVLFVEFIGLSVFIGILMWLGLDIMSFNINICLFSYQVIDLFYVSSQRTGMFLDVVMSIFQFNEHNKAYPSYCLWDGLDPMQKTAFGFVIPAWMIVFMAIIHRCSLDLDRWYKTLSIVGVMCFTDVLRVSFNLLAPIKIDSKMYVYIYADVSYFGKEHLPYGIIALIVVSVIAVLLIASMYFVYKNDHRMHVLRWLSLDDYLKTDNHWFCFFYIVCRVFIYGVGIFMVEDLTRHTVLCVMCFVITLIPTFVQPYVTQQNNVVECFVLFTLTCINVISLGHGLVYFECIKKRYVTAVQVLSFVPLVAVVYSLVAFFYHKFRKDRLHPKRSESGISGPMRVWENSKFESEYKQYEEIPDDE